MLTMISEAMPLLLAIVGVFIVLFLASMSRASSEGDLDWQLARIERKLDLILTNLGIAHDEHIPKSVAGLAQAGRKIEAIKEYRRLTGASLIVAKREIEHLMSRSAPDTDANAIERRTD